MVGLKLLTVLCPALAVYLKYKEAPNTMKMVFLAAILTLIFWIPGVIFAYWACFIASTDNNSAKIIELKDRSASFASLKLYNPTPVHPKANQIISFPATMATVTIMFPEEQNANELITNYDNDNNLKSCMV